MRTHQRSGSIRHHASAGFSFIEFLVVMVIMGVLAAIAAPSFLAYANARRADTGADQVFQIFRSAKTQAGRVRRPQVVEFNPDNTDPAQIRAGSVSDDPESRPLQTLGNGEFPAGLAKLEVLDDNGATVDELQFDEQGNIDATFASENNLQLPITMTVIVPSPDTNPDITGEKRCVIIETLLGATRQEKDEQCES